MLKCRLKDILANEPFATCNKQASHYTYLRLQTQLLISLFMVLDLESVSFYGSSAHVIFIS